MTQIGEAFNLPVPGVDKPCPFCESKEKKPKFDELVLTNDAKQLGDSLGDGTVVMKDPVTEKDWYIKEQYWVSKNRSGICMNAHHVIPGNAALSRVPAILQWMAGTVIFEKKWYEKAPAVRQKKKAGAYDTQQIAGAPSQEISFDIGKSKGKKSVPIIRYVITEEKLVTGKVEYDVNAKPNGKWLPSNNAVAGWGNAQNMNATDLDGEDGTFAEAYSYNAMRASDRQFHDAHPAYSKAVRIQLGNLEEKVSDRAEACKGDCPNSQFKTKKTHPAPQKLKESLDQIAKDIMPKLDVPPKGKKPAAPWITSRLAEQF